MHWGTLVNPKMKNLKTRRNVLNRFKKFEKNGKT